MVTRVGAARERATRARSSTGPSTTSWPDALTESVAGFDRVAALAPQAAPQLWQRGIALYYAGPLPGLPRAVRVAPHGQSQRRREPGVALHVRREGRVAGEGARRAAAGRTRSAIADARDLPDVSRHDDARRDSARRPAASRRRASSPSCMWACTTTRPAIGPAPSNTCVAPPPRTTRAPAATCTASRSCIRSCGAR